MRRAFLISFCALMAIFSINSTTWALGLETVGNKPLNAANFKNWPGIMPVVNHNSRVYHSWVNGNEQFYYHGNNESLNDALQKFSETDSKVREVVLRPAPGTVYSFNKEKKYEFNWNLHIVGGIASSMAKRDLGANIWSKNPILTIYVGGDIQLDKIKIPAGVKVLELSDLEERYSKAFKSTDKTVRGWSAGHLARLNSHNKDNMKIIAKLLSDKENWIRLNAAGALAVFGKTAESALPALNKALDTNDKNLKTRIQETIERIEKAEDNTAAEKEHQKILLNISQFRKSLTK
jgi:HEAT repeats